MYTLLWNEILSAISRVRNNASKIFKGSPLSRRTNQFYDGYIEFDLRLEVPRSSTTADCGPPANKTGSFQLGKKLPEISHFRSVIRPGNICQEYTPFFNGGI